MIDEKKLIEELEKWMNDTEYLKEKYYGATQFKDGTGEWIPCSERLPELHRVDMQSSGEYYMISESVIITDGESIGLTKYEVDDDDRKGWLECEFEGNEDVVAWMPLPEPYKGE